MNSGKRQLVAWCVILSKSHACFMSNRLGAVDDAMTNLKGYVERVAARPAFQKAINL